MPVEYQLFQGSDRQYGGKQTKRQRRAHSPFDNVPWPREAFPQEFWLNAADARKLGIATGHIVKITSRHGAVIRPAYVTERIMPGVVALGQGAWLELDEKTGLDKAGTTNVLNGPIPTGQGHSGYNSCNVRVENMISRWPLIINGPSG